jgi:hypothetical protein
MTGTGAADSIREILSQTPDISVSDLVAALPQYKANTIRTLVSRYRNDGLAPKPKHEVENALIADHLAGKINAEQLSKALHMRGDIEKQRTAFVEVMIRANNTANALATATTEEELTKAHAERIAIVKLLGGTFPEVPPAIPAAPVAPSQVAIPAPPIPAAPIAA